MAKAPIVRVTYVDGTTLSLAASEWRWMRAEGIDWVAIGHEKFTMLSGQSLYWVYAEGDFWVMGGGPVGYGAVPPEVLVGRDDEHISRPVQFMPDLMHRDVKLGHWWPNEPRRPIDG